MIARLSSVLCVAVIHLSTVTFPVRAEDSPPPPKVVFGELDNRQKAKEQQAVLDAIAKGDLAEIKRLDSVLELKSISNLGADAWFSPNVEVIDFLVNKRKIVASELQMAAVHGDVAAVRLVLKRLKERDYPPGSDYAERNQLTFDRSLLTSFSPLRLAIRRGHTEVVRVLIAGGANVDEPVIDSLRRNPNVFPLGEAVQLGREEIVQLLVDGRARLLGEEGAVNANTMCPLTIAICNGRAKIVSILLKAGANPNVLFPKLESLPYGVETDLHATVDRRPLHVAALKGNPEIVRLLIDKGADVNAPTSAGETPLTYAVRHRHGDVADILRAAGGKEK